MAKDGSDESESESQHSELSRTMQVVGFGNLSSSQMSSSQPSIRRRASTLNSIREGRPRAGSRFRLASRSDMQMAVTFMEGKVDDTQEDDDHVSQSSDKGDVQHVLLPLGLLSSLLIGGVCMLVLQRRLVEGAFGTARTFTILAASIYAIAVCCMGYVAFTPPGKITGEGNLLPKRAHKGWQYDGYILRYDHYCRWVNNCIGLRNHREFMVMLVTFVTISVSGAVVDLTLAWVSRKVLTLFSAVALVLHLLYSFVFAYYVIPIFRLHVVFVSRNELANEWKNDAFYVVPSKVTGEPVWVGALDPVEFNERFDTFKYESSRNEFDHGCRSNCLAFWCTARCSAGQLGEF